MTRLGVTITAILCVGAAASAEPANAPLLPQSARKLSGAEVKTLYDGMRATFENFTQSELLTGSITHDLRQNTQFGDFVMGGQKGSFRGSSHVKGDRYCYRSEAGRESCYWVFANGQTFYEVNSRGVVDTVKKPLRAAAE